ncbi:hypothetical protein L195_g055877, partial [Trifolium pratense]
MRNSFSVGGKSQPQNTTKSIIVYRTIPSAVQSLLHSSISSTAVHSPSQFNLEPQSVKPSAVEELQPLRRSLLFSAFP